MKNGASQENPDSAAFGGRTSLIIDCDCCAMRDTSACDDCVVSALLSIGKQPIELSSAESSALDALAEVGLIPRLRLLPRDGGEAAAAS